jgi:hypothetical protein
MQHGSPKRLYLPFDMVPYSNILNRLHIFALVLSCDSLQALGETTQKKKTKNYVYKLSFGESKFLEPGWLS